MIYEQIPIQMHGSRPYARLVTYLWEASPEIPIENRPLVLICPGGGYEMTSDREAEAVALRVMNMGFHAAVLRYSVAPAEFPTALLEVAKSVQIIREHSKKWKIDSEKLVIMGFSAGGHLAASYSVFWNQPWLLEKAGAEAELLQPNALLLGYPVITAKKEFIHEGSFRNLLGEQWSLEQQEWLSVEQHVGEQVPRTFLWHTFADDTVPVENSLLWVQALCRHKIPVEFHLYEKGCHGLSLANELTENQAHCCVQEECQSWIRLAEVWLKNL